MPVTDDISSAPLAERAKRRGVAGDLVVFKTAAAAAERGDSLAEVLAVARHANDNTRTLGLAFSGCKFPGAEQPLFTVPEGKMGFGLGIHGEPGISELPISSSHDIASKLTEKLLEERPETIHQTSGARLGVIINGLGSVKYEELFVLWNDVHHNLEKAGVELVDVQIGEFVTSFDMAGFSVSFIWFEGEIEELWLAPATTPAFSRGSVLSHEPLDPVQLQQSGEVKIPEATEESKAAAASTMVILNALETLLTEKCEELGHIDAIAGDGDHGIGMLRGVVAACKAANQALNKGAGVGFLLQTAADAWSDDAGGTSGAIWGVILNTLGTTLGNSEKPTVESVTKGVVQANHGVMHFGKAKPGDKTLVDVLMPFSEALDSAAAEGLSLAEAWHKAAQVAEKSAAATAGLVPKIGRARPLAERSVGTPDAGAVSLALMIATVDEHLSNKYQNARQGEQVCQ